MAAALAAVAAPAHISEATNSTHPILHTHAARFIIEDPPSADFDGSRLALVAIRAQTQVHFLYPFPCSPSAARACRLLRLRIGHWPGQGLDQEHREAVVQPAVELVMIARDCRVERLFGIEAAIGD